jgi:hypothetical protein
MGLPMRVFWQISPKSGEKFLANHLGKVARVTEVCAVTGTGNPANINGGTRCKPGTKLLDPTLVHGVASLPVADHRWATQVRRVEERTTGSQRCHVCKERGTFAASFSAVHFWQPTPDPFTQESLEKRLRGRRWTLLLCDALSTGLRPPRKPRKRRFEYHGGPHKIGSTCGKREREHTAETVAEDNTRSAVDDLGQIRQVRVEISGWFDMKRTGISPPVVGHHGCRWQ